MKVKVLFFASCRELAGTKEIAVTLEGAENSTEALRKKLVELLPALEPVAWGITLAVNHEYTDPGQNVQLKDGDEVALIPPISGG
ncbi:hypothetical protein JKP88DRAFT_199012 [Tribonema minus]|uniref:Molybdopterin synthase sulfur carrier subunit n=1 Tax=Tribonema minus TaxID=303371 RepID=A0A835YXW6_9STRA|nr:hypothetical protein JKP88DRAFT_199012 [Tribonema minus]